MGALAGLTSPMARTKQSPEFAIEVDGQPYVWRLQRQPQWAGGPTDWRGMAIAVRHKEGQREAALEFPPGPQPRYGASQLQASQIAPTLVAKAIGSAIVAGWEPLSRGKTVDIIVDATGG
jgi:hypothetical protein